MKTLYTLQPQDTIQNTQGTKCKVITVSDTLVARSCWYPRYDVFSEWITIQDLERNGWKVLEDDKEVITKEEAEILLGNKKIVN